MKIMRLYALCVGVLLVLSIPVAAYGQIFSVVYNFGSQSGDPHNPIWSGIWAQGRDGNLYSTTPGGTLEVADGVGDVFQLTPKGNLTVLYSFDVTHGSYPSSGLTLATDGNFYGTTGSGGTSDYGTIFKITPGGVLTVLYNFTNGSDGSLPYAPPIQGTDGNFYGTAAAGGSGGRGTVYKITPTGIFTPLYQFDGTHGQDPQDPLVLGTDGNFYGTTEYGSTIGVGVIFRITPAGNLTVLHSFDGTDGGLSLSPLVQGTDGNFYGTSATGGPSDAGVVFKMTPSGTFTVLHSMNGTSDGSDPHAGLVLATDSNFYGVNSNGGTVSAGCPFPCGTLFKITPTGVFSVLDNFDGPTGIYPYVTPFQHTNGLIYGDTIDGGTGNVSPCSTAECGVVYSWNQGLHSFVRALTYSGKVGKVIEFLGQRFIGTSAVSFNGTPAKFTVVSATYMTAVVPTGATSGSVTVTTPSGTLTSDRKFRVTP